MKLIRGGVKIWKCKFEVHFKGPHFARVINPCESFKTEHKFKNNLLNRPFKLRKSFITGGKLGNYLQIASME